MINKTEFLEKSKILTAKQMSEYFNIQKAYVYSLCRKLEIKPQKEQNKLKNKDTIAKVKELRKQGLKLIDISKNLNISLPCLSIICKNNNIENPNKKKRAEKIEMIVYLRQRYTLESIGQLLGCTRERVRQLESYAAENNEHTKAQACQILLDR